MTLTTSKCTIAGAISQLVTAKDCDLFTIEEFLSLQIRLQILTLNNLSDNT